MTVDGIKAEAVTGWLDERVDIAPPLKFEVIPGGRSNLTYRVTDTSGRRWVLRRPPLHGVLASAHDVAREYRLMDALQPTAVPVPSLVGLEEDPTVTGGPFYMMDFVDGLVVRDAEIAREELDVDGRRAAAWSLVDVLVDLHRVDPDEVGLDDLAKREDYMARQLKRWDRQVREGSPRDLALLHEVHDRLAASIPEQGPATIVHGDYRLDNLIVSPAGEVRAVLDWELCTLGDPMADLGLLMVYWSESEDEEVLPLGSSPTTVEGFPTRREVAERYAERSGRDIGELDYFQAFGYWKLAGVLEGVYTRFAAGAYAHEDEGVKAFGQVVLQLGERAAEMVERAGR